MSHGGEEVGAGAVRDAMRETAARCRQARQEDPRKQSHAWGRSSNNTKSVHLGLVMVFSMSYSFRSDVRLFSFRPQVHQVGRDSEQPPRRGSSFHAGQQVSRKKSQAWNKRPFL